MKEIAIAAKIILTILITAIAFAQTSGLANDDSIFRNGFESMPQAGQPQPLSGWHWQRGGNFLDADFPSLDTGWFGGDVLIKAVRVWDGTWNWYQQAYDFTDQRTIVDLDFFDENYGWALASDGTIICTTNGGVTWQLFSEPMAGMEITGLDMTGPGHGNAIARSNDDPNNRKATILYSENCGASWQVVHQSKYFVEIPYDIEMYSSQIGVAVGKNASWGTDKGFYWWTEDGWQTARHQEVSQPLLKTTVPTSEDFYALNGDYMIHFNRDQWDTEITLPSGFSADDVYFKSLSNGWLVGANIQGFLEVLHTNNRGATWSRQLFNTPTTHLTPTVITSSGDSSLYVSGSTATNTGTFYSSGITMNSDDGGGSWNRVEGLCSVQPEHFSLATQAGPDSPGMLMGWLGHSKASLKLEAGAWHAPTIEGVRDFPPYNLWGGVAMIDAMNAWATSSLGGARDGDSVLWHTTNGGRSWTQSIKSQFGGGGPIYAPDSQHIWAMFYNKPWDQSVTLLKSSNGGGNWSTGADNVYIPSHLYTNDGTRGWVVNNNSLLRTTDGGATFQGKHVCGIDNIDWIDGNNGWVLCGKYLDTVNQQNVFDVKQTQDGGNTWQTITELRGPIGTSYANLNFQDNQVGYVHNYDHYQPRTNRLLKTEDGGITWYAVPDGFSAPGYGRFTFLEVGSSGQGWAISETGTILYHGLWRSRQSIGASGGDVISADGGRLVVHFPAGSLSTAAEAILTVYEPSADAAHIYELTLSPQTPLNQPLKLTAQYPVAPLTAASGTATPQLAQWRNDQWEPLANIQYDPATGKITASADEPGFFAIRESSSNDGNVNSVYRQH